MTKEIFILLPLIAIFVLPLIFYIIDCTIFKALGIDEKSLNKKRQEIVDLQIKIKN